MVKIWRLRDLFVQSFFVLLNSDKLIETPNILHEYETLLYDLYKNTIEEQLFLSDNGVSFSYTDTIDSQSRQDLILILLDWREKHPKETLL